MERRVRGARGSTVPASGQQCQVVVEKGSRMVGGSELEPDLAERAAGAVRTCVPRR